MKRLAIITTLLLATSVLAQSTPHLWQLQFSQIVTNQYGQRVKACTWECVQYNHSRHTTQTIGTSTYVCPRPSVY